VAAQAGNVIELFGERRGRCARVDEPRVTKKQLAAHFGVSTKTIERYMAKLGLPFEKPYPNGAVRFVLSDVERWWVAASQRAV
jgi:predicted DNA-binding transcriptional regulator AlpA